MRHLLLCTILFTLIFSPFGWTQNVVIDANGEAGKPAIDGATYSTHPGASYSSASNGGHALAPSPGGDGGDIRAHLKDVSQSEQIFKMKLDFSIDSSRRQKNESMVLDLEKLSSILFSANGGEGQRGGIGGNGQGGCNGRDGSDAKEDASGTDGTAGCNGGNAGKGTSGSDGGQGGSVKIVIDEEDTHLLLKTRCDVQGGQGGRAGKHGEPGQGGSGGRGGSSYSWSEIYDCNCGNRQSSNGNGSYSYSYECDSCSRSYSKSGGSSGSNGSSGSRQYQSLFSGKDGKNGLCEFVVNENGISKTYTNPFDVSILSYVITDENQDSIFEPNENITISQIRIKNKNGVPTPAKKAQLQLYIAGQNLIADVSNQLTIPQLKAGQEITLKESLKFKLKIVKVNANDVAWSKAQDLDFKNFVTRVNEEVKSLKRNDKITVEFPFQVTTFTFPNSGAAGEVLPVIWKIKNISSKKMSLNDELTKRNIQLKLEKSESKNRSLSPKEVIFTDEFGKTFNLDQGFVKTLSELKPNQEVVVHGTITIPVNAQPYANISARYLFSLNTFKSEKTQVVQQKEASLRVSLVYKHNPDADVLLITNKTVTANQYQYWANLMKKLGLKINIWDASYYNMLSFFKEYETKRTLSEDFKNKNVVILNAHNLEQTSQLSLDFFRLIASNNTRVLMIGASEADGKSFVRKVLSFRDDHLNNQSQLPVEMQNKIKLTELKLFGREVTDDKLKSEVEEIAKKLKVTYPESRFTINAKDQRRENTSFLGQQPVAEIEIFKTIPHQGAHFYMIPTIHEQKHNQVILKEEEGLRALFLSFSVDLKFKTLFYAKNADQRLKQIVNRSLIYDVIGDLLFTKNLAENSKTEVKPNVLTEVLTYIYKDLKLTYGAIELLSSVEWYLNNEKSLFANPKWLIRSLNGIESYFDYIKTNQKMICQLQLKEVREKCLQEKVDNVREKVFSELDLKYKNFKKSTPLDHEEIIQNIFIKPAVDQVISTEDATRENVILYN